MKRLALTAGSFVVSLLLVELLLRLAWTNPYRNEIPDHVVDLRIHHPFKALPVDRRDARADAPTTVLRSDARGYLLPSRRFEHPDASILFLGGSTTECAAVSEDERFPALVSSLLEREGLRVDTLNAGRSGNTTHDAINILLNWGAEDAPDVVVLMEAANDIGVLRQDGSYRSRSGRPLTAAVARTWLLQRASSVSWVAGAVRNWVTVGNPLRRKGPLPRPSELEAVPTQAYEKRLRAFVAVAKALGTRPVLMTQPLARRRTALTPEWTTLDDQNRFNDVIRRVAAEEQVVLVDLARHVSEEIEGWDEPMRLFYDGIHVTDFGSRVYAEYIAARLRESVFGPRGLARRSAR